MGKVTREVPEDYEGHTITWVGERFGDVWTAKVAVVAKLEGRQLHFYENGPTKAWPPNHYRVVNTLTIIDIT